MQTQRATRGQTTMSSGTKEADLNQKHWANHHKILNKQKQYQAEPKKQLQAKSIGQTDYKNTNKNKSERGMRDL